jgi:hypothetical protein
VVLGQMPFTPQGFGDTSQTILQAFQHRTGSLGHGRSKVKRLAPRTLAR